MGKDKQRDLNHVEEGEFDNWRREEIMTPWQVWIGLVSVLLLFVGLCCWVGWRVLS